ncbi:hypothetical protein AAA799E16_00377 [Marine Group I thaumarchaeote SCGC AAA799-E16]|uniref:Uncharacterized protein n=2 Tax=Marine Group I TaxID=905826 RepID=A0A087RVW5_9ARCH|nr:hypothetical protein AAA799E16_00377 [Marine Group I thaumarchaeote SCGC AAA799-E16]KFM17619.1 hypothetical protein SCCGRSA3_01549 [Marine Group I thaumarchaeote SCGC RSA3]
MSVDKNLAVKGWIGIGIIVVIIVGVVMVLLPGEPEEKPDFEKTREQQWEEYDKEFEAKKQAALDKQEQVELEEAKLDTEEKVTEFMQNYKGIDNSGTNLYDAVGLVMEVAYMGEDILASPATDVWVLASPDYSREVSDKYWKFEININTYREKVHLEWIIDTETSSVYPVNEDSKIILDILDAE